VGDFTGNWKPLVEPWGSNPFALFRQMKLKRDRKSLFNFILAEREGFEPSKGF
jgi:hypothetical protein